MTAASLHALPKIPVGARLAFVETADEAQVALDTWTRHAFDAAVVLAPEAASALRGAGRPYLALEDAYDPRRICDLADPVLDTQQAWAATVDQWLHRRIPAFAERDFRPARLYLYWLKIAFDSLAIRVYPMQWALERWQPSWVWHPAAAASHGEFGWDLLFRNSLYPAVLRSVAAQLNIDAQVSEPAGVTRHAIDSAAPPHWIRRPRAVEWLVRKRSILRMAWEGALRPRRVVSGDLLILGDGYDLRPVWGAARRKRMAVERWGLVVKHARTASSREVDVSHTMADAWAPALQEAELLAPAVVSRCDLRHLVEARLRFWWEVLIPEQWRAFATVREQWAGKRVQAVAVSGLADHIERGAFAAMRSLGARTYIYQHGGFVGACECPPWDCNDLALADYELTYGAGTADYFRSRGARYADRRATAIAVGSSRLDTLQRSIPRGRPASQRKRILIVPNLIPRNSRYFDAGTTPDVLESELQEAVVAIARECAAYEFIFKAFPYHDQRETPAVALAGAPGSNCRVEFDKPLPALIARADLIVLLFPSTALLEALLSDRSVIVQVDPRFVSMRPSARAALDRRALVVDSPARLLQQLRRVLQDGRFPVSVPVDDLFLREYGTHLDDGQSADRALAALASAPVADAWGHVVVSPPTVS
jgi:hypothetical protein